MAGHRLCVTPSALADVIGCAEGTLRAARHVTRADIRVFRDRESPRQRAILFELESALRWARAHAGLSDRQEEELRRRARPLVPHVSEEPDDAA